MDEQELRPIIEQARVGNADAWRQLFQCCQPRLLRDAQRLLGPNWHRISPRDLTQETWLKAQRGIAGYQGRGFFSWLSAIMRNVYRNSQRRKPPGRDALPKLLATGLHNSDSDSGDRAGLDPVAPQPTASSTLLEWERQVILREAIAALEPQTREILWMSADETSLSFREIGVRLGLSEKQVATRYHRGIEQLKSQLKSLHD